MIVAKKNLIMSVSLRGDPAAVVYSVSYDNEGDKMLSVSSVDLIKRGWTRDLNKQIEAMQAKGSAIVLDCEYDLIPEKWLSLANYDLDEVLLDGRPSLWKGLDLYQALVASGSIAYFDEVAKFAIKVGGEGARIESKPDGYGRRTYEFDRDALGGPQRAVLTTILSVYSPNLDEMYLDKLFSESNRLQQIENEKDGDNPVQRMARALMMADRRRTGG